MGKYNSKTINIFILNYNKIEGIEELFPKVILQDNILEKRELNNKYFI